jgi:hypothetical protein
MLKRNTFLIISLLVVMAAVFGTSVKVDAKAWPNCPFEYTHNQGPAIRAHFDFLIDGYVVVSGSCKNITIEPSEPIDAEWQELDTGDDGLDKADLQGNVFQITNTDPLWGLVVECYGIDTGTTQTVCVKIVSVHNFTDNDDGTYSADMIFMRVVID